ncbi:hypothetical protein AAG570_001307 [Ranatra chinensis]|uniref:protein-serine/threonine phosphatase n=1 Tax=Ranatra chinensis TaxID=642074 RepID=A0ABD0YBH4_9HEMI
MKTFKAQGRLHERYACKILLQVGELFSKVPSLVDITLGKDETFTICGDIHGQFYDLMNIFEINGFPSPSKGYLFNGDFVDRGAFSVECALTLFAYKLLYPDNFHLARGNHESSAMNALYGFEKEVNAKYPSWMARLFAMVFNQLPLAHCFNGKVLVLHGGLFSEEGVTLNDIRSIERNREPPEEGLMSDILWSDPQEEMGRSPSGRGAGVRFGPDVTEKFLASNELKYIIRSHEAKSEGYEIGQGGKCLTVFSAPNYRDVMGNKGAFIRFRGKDLMAEFVTFEAVRHPEPIN